jgi:mono/diheme cytochrome c family protein
MKRTPGLKKVRGFAVFLFLLSATQLFAQKKTQQETLAQYPEEVANIFKTSCVGCHNDQSNSKSKDLLNLSAWDQLKKKEKVKAGKIIMKEVIEKKMPPEGMVKRRPELALNDDQVKTLAAWAKNIKKEKK